MLDEVNKCGPNPHVNTKVDTINKTAQRFREVRSQLGITQQEMANRLFLQRNTIAKIEAGLATPSARTVSAVESLLNKSTPEGSSRSDAVQEAGTVYGRRMMLDPKHALPKQEPTEADLRVQIEQVLTAARTVPGGFHHLSRTLKRFQKDFLEDIEE